MLDLLVKDLMEPDKLLMLSPETTVGRAAAMMAEKNVGAAIVVEHQRLLGIFTERDALFRVIATGLDPSTTHVLEVMTPEPHTVGPNTTYGHALVLMQENGFRHVPVVEEGKPIGIVGSRNAMDPELEQFVSEVSRREHFREEH